MKRLLLLLWVLVLALGLITPAHSTVMPGDQFIVTATDTSPNGQFTEYQGNAIATAGDLANLDSLPLSSTPHPTDPNAGQTIAISITLGNPVSPNLFAIESFTNIFGTPLLTVDLSGAFFDSATLDLQGDVTGSFLGGGGGLHYFDLRLFENGMGAGTWIYYNDHTGLVSGAQLGSPFTDVSSGIYTTAAAQAPEPSTMLLLVSGLIGLTGYGRKKFFKK